MARTHRNAGRYTHLEVDTTAEEIVYKGRRISFDLLDTLVVADDVQTEFDPQHRTLTLRATVWNVDTSKERIH